MYLHPDGLLPHVAASLQEAGFKTLTTPLVWIGKGDPALAFEKVAREHHDLEMYCGLGEEGPAQSLAAAVNDNKVSPEQRQHFRDWIVVGT